jgi:hypothetical protein
MKILKRIIAFFGWDFGQLRGARWSQMSADYRWKERERVTTSRGAIK